MKGSIRAVMVFAEEPRVAAAWWAQLLGVPVEGVHEKDFFFWFDADGIEFGFHPADPERNPVGGSPVVYFAATDIDDEVSKALALGATRHRGPLGISESRTIVQMVDPFGTIFGIDAG